jgi:hypothetical protein
MFLYNGDCQPTTVFTCDPSLSSWSLAWKEIPRKQLRQLSRVHYLIGLQVLEMKALDNNMVVLIIKECLPNSKKIVTYELILEVIKLNLLDCKLMTDLGLLYFKMNNPI